jgi:hypothetical protein
MLINTNDKEKDSFLYFRQNTEIVKYIENCTYETALGHIAYINKMGDMLWSYVDKFRTSDKIGAPRVYDFPGIGKFAPTTIRYIRFLEDLIDDIGSLNNLNIVLINSGYGGLVKIIYDVFTPRNVVCVDEDPCLRICEMFLGKFDIQILKTCSNVDLVINTPNDHLEYFKIGTQLH